MKKETSIDKIRAAFCTLAREQDLETIKILQITKLAGISKTTFYANFENMDSLAENLIDHLLENADILLRKKQETVLFPESRYPVISEYLIDHREFFRKFCRSKYGVYWARSMQQYISGIIAQHLRILKDPAQNRPAQISFFAHAYVSYVLEGLLLDNTAQMKDAAMFLCQTIQASAKWKMAAWLSPFGLRNIASGCPF